MWLRVGIIFFGVSLATTLGITYLKLSTMTRLLAPYAIAFGVAIPVARQMDRHFAKLRAMATDMLKQKRYADARIVLLAFTRFGNMSFDRDGEAHYLLVHALVGLNEPEEAAKMVKWLQSYRSRYPFAEKAAQALPRPRRVESPPGDAEVEGDEAEPGTPRS
jgi:hypothetical protein